jgi:hypothetical protein
LIALGLGELLWQTLLQATLPPLQVFVMLLLASGGATAGIYPALSRKLFSWLMLGLNYIQWFVIASAIGVGGFLGYGLTLGFHFSPFTLIGILPGMAVAAVLVLRADYRLKHP